MSNENKTILIVEDDIPMLYALHEKLTYEGFNAIKARDGKEGLELAKENHPDLILLDLIMPKMDGITMLKKLRKDSWGKGVAVIILTNLSDDKQMKTAMKQGTYDYLIKSDWKIEDVITKIREKLG